MLARVLAMGRPVVARAEVASRAAGVAALDISLACTSTLRGDGGEASTSYESSTNAIYPWIDNQHLQSPPPSSAPPCRTFATAAPHSSSGSTSASTVTAPASPSATSALASTSTFTSMDATDPFHGLDMESLLRVLLHPLPLGRKVNTALLSGAAVPAVQLGREALFFDPSATLSSTMRALHVIRRVLRDDGHVLIINSNPTMRPLLCEAAHLCLNRNIWFWYRDWQPGALSDTNRSMDAVLNPHYCQPNRRLMTAHGLTLRNPLCPPGSLEYNRLHRLPKLSDEDTKRLEAGRKAVSRQRHDRERAREHCQTLEALAVARAAEARLLPAGVHPAVGRGGRTGRLALVVALDLSYGGGAVREASERKIPTVSLLNGHSDAAHVTFPVYASESHAGFQHFFLEWLLRVVNLPPPAAAARPAHV